MCSIFWFSCSPSPHVIRITRSVHRFLVALALAALCATTYIFLSTQALAQTGQTVPRATEIRIEGAQRIDPETVRSYLSIRLGDQIDPETLDRSLKSLFGTGLFADVSLRREGNIVVVRIVENPIINRIVFEGNQRLKSDTLANEVQLKPRKVYTRTQVQNDVQRIIDLYRRGGRFAAMVEPKIIQLPQNRVDLVFEIFEGSLTEIRKIAFVGNKKFDDSELREVIQTKESAWFRILSSSDTYDPDRLTFDRELLRRHYLASGYADFRVVSAVAELSPDLVSFFVTFTLDEGERYKFGKIEIETGLREVDSEKLREFLTVKDGDWYNADALEATIKKLSDAVGILGYAFVDVKPQVKRDRDARIINVVFNLEEGPRVFVERINITGNLRTADRVIRRELLLVEGDAFNTLKMQRSRQRIRNLGFFEQVEVGRSQGASADKADVNVSVRERSTGEVSLGAGYSTTSGMLGDISLRERNLLGEGQDLRLRLSIGQRETNAEVSFTEPYLVNRNLAGGFDIFRTTRDLQRESSHDRDSIGFTLRSGYLLSEWLNQQVRYTLRQDDVTAIKSTASLAIKEQEGKATSSLVGQTLTYDRRDNRLDPRDGYFIAYANDYSGIGGSVDYLRNRLFGGYFIPISAEVVSAFSASGGYIFGIGERTRINDRFFAGGAALRGFRNGGVGPRDASTGDALGGNWAYRGSAEVTFPIGLPNELGVKGKLFGDGGSVGDVDTPGHKSTDTGGIRISVGTGIAWASPFGPLSVDVARPVKKESFDKTETVRFTFGTRF